ncbi:MAG: glycosyltransferase WbuB [Sphingobacteriales bacterium]|nr:MAG: glycosyltransferase WbuB [Sphingobacteriales bacterium]
MGAPQSRLYETAVGLKQRGWDVLVVTAMPNYPTGKIFDRYSGKLLMQDKVDGIDILRYALYASNSRKSLPRIISMISFSVMVMFSLVRLRQFKPDYVFTESPPLTLGLSGLILARLCGARHVMNVSDLWPLSAYKLGAISKGFIYNRLEGLERYLYKNSYACTGQSQQIVSQLAESGSRYAHLYRNGVDVSRFDDQRPEPTPKHTRKLRIVYAGLLGVAQGILDLCRNINFAELGVEFHIYGEGAEKTELETFLLQHSNRATYLHQSVKRNEVPITIMQYDATIIPLIKPIFGAIPSKIYEAMAAGLPIIFTGGGEGAEIVQEYRTGWVCEPADYFAISNMVRQISAMEQEELDIIRENCILAARQVFNRETQIERLNEFLLNAN